MKSVNLTKVNFSPKWFIYFIAAVIVVLAAYGVGKWVYGKVAGFAGGATSVVTGSGATNGGW